MVAVCARCSSARSGATVTSEWFLSGVDDHSSRATRSSSQVRVPELIFGTLLTGSNYDDERDLTTGGRNG